MLASVSSEAATGLIAVLGPDKVPAKDGKGQRSTFSRISAHDGVLSIISDGAQADVPAAVERQGALFLPTRELRDALSSFRGKQMRARFEFDGKHFKAGNRSTRVFEGEFAFFESVASAPIEPPQNLHLSA